MKNRNVSSEESEYVYAYIVKHSLQKPSTSISKVFLSILWVVITSTISLFLIYYFFRKIGIELPKRFIFFFILFEYLFNQKQILIGLIHLYQHYAPKEIRRKCMCKPTCSEYGEQVINKFGSLIGLIKLFKRLFFTCRGTVYFIDEP